MDIAAEKIKPYNDGDRPKGEQVRDMFDNIAPAYDFMNRAMTFGIDKLWRRKAVNMIKKHCLASSAKNYEILDIATGTGDLAIKLAKSLPSASVCGVDLSEGMVAICRKKVAKAKLEHRIKAEIADCLALPYGDNEFDCITVAYGVRNFQSLLTGYKEMHRVLKPGGYLCVIELSTPTSKIAAPFYRFYTRKIIPAVGRIVSKDTRAYSYLPESIAAVPQGAEMASLITEAGFSNAAYRPLTFGTCTIYTATKNQ